ncbi:hypothetical protein EDD73_1352 [Heliophilum fasciatum]|uniref:Uncharacterized protein n=1 Tax=Heliophilum fasciatum TaxID=35700 RepID=A0A4R2RDM9_9FIRM|nr:hypothetical protein [Heliophilum fasciatum]TCP60614.1 hypothetical protein EDD73_1352 [Heliophilum fasciatum]
MDQKKGERDVSEWLKKEEIGIESAWNNRGSFYGYIDRGHVTRHRGEGGLKKRMESPGL